MKALRRYTLHVASVEMLLHSQTWPQRLKLPRNLQKTIGYSDSTIAISDIFIAAKTLTFSIAADVNKVTETLYLILLRQKFCDLTLHSWLDTLS